MPHMHNVSAYIKKNVKQMQICFHIRWYGSNMVWTI